MPPPTVTDPWLASRRFGVVIDAGSSGSRLQIYSWKDPRAVRDAGIPAVLNTLPAVEKGTRTGEDWVTKVEPGLSSFAENTDGLPTYLAPLLEHARTQIPPSLQAETPLFLLATAGMRLLSPTQQAQVLQATCDFLRLHSHFRIDDPSPVGPCGSSVRIITGEEEGLFGWIAVNYLMDGFKGTDEERTTYGFLDMGGASTQIAFEPDRREREKDHHLMDVRLRLLGGQEINHKVFVTTWLGYGTNQARERYVDKIITDYESSNGFHHYSASGSEEYIEDPCLPKGLTVTDSPAQSLSTSDSSTSNPHSLVGTGAFEQCLQQTAPLLNKDAPCTESPCLFNGVHVPPIDFSASHFIGVSEYWYSSEHVFGLGGPYDVVQYERAASEFCSRDWSQILDSHELSRENGTLGGDGEVIENGEVVSTGQWGNDVEISRLQMQCFKAAWIVNVLHEGIGLPRIVDPGGNGTTNGANVAQQAEDKGLGRPQFQSMDTVGNIAISWTLGKMVLEASKEVPPLSSSTRPLVDPIDDISNTAHPTIKPIRPPFLDFDAIEDHLSGHIPHALTRQSLGFSPIGFIFYFLTVLIFLSTIYRLRHRIRSTLRRCMRRKDRDYIALSYNMEEGHALNSGYSTPSRPSSPARGIFHFLNPFRRLTSSGSRVAHPASILVTSPTLRSSQSSPTHISPSPHRSPIFAPPDFVPGSPHFYTASLISNGSVSSLTSRSRNSSRMDLSSMVSKQMVPRTSSALM